MEEEVKLAYAKLGLPEGASREDVEKRYDILLRRSKSNRSGEGDDFGEINRAYKTIAAYEDRKTVNSITEQQYGKYKRYAKQAEKVDHFVSYYKWHVVGVIAAIGLLIYGITAFIDHREEQARLAALPPVDLEASFLGLFYLPEDQRTTDALEAAMLEPFPEWNRVEASVQSFNLERPDQMDLAMQQKIVVQMATENPDIYVMDNATFEWIARNRVLLELEDAVEGRLKALLPEGAARKAVVQLDALDENTTEEHVYGIDLGASPLAESLPLAMRDMIIGIRVDAEHPENALLFIERYLQAMQQP
ncbi:hypothetical protein MO973_00395 [Paenibacillus sp. TRM 82003]|nr:hypothetical protein [Paenibacillus sp. TRM 82003]